MLLQTTYLYIAHRKHIPTKSILFYIITCYIHTKNYVRRDLVPAQTAVPRTIWEQPDDGPLAGSKHVVVVY